jgi:hypothetical protein
MAWTSIEMVNPSVNWKQLRICISNPLEKLQAAILLLKREDALNMSLLLISLMIVVLAVVGASAWAFVSVSKSLFKTTHGKRLWLAVSGFFLVLFLCAPLLVGKGNPPLRMSDLPVVIIVLSLPLLGLYAQVIAFSWFIAAGVPRNCKYWLVSSLALAIGGVPVASLIGSGKYNHALSCLLWAELLVWFICVFFAFLQCKKLSATASLGLESRYLEESRTALPSLSLLGIRPAMWLWALAAVDWAGVLYLAAGAAEKTM